MRLYNGDCFDILKTMPDKSVDAVITDPPYGMGIDKWDNKIDIAKFTEECRRVSKSFYTFFSQMPRALEWNNEAMKLFHYVEHIAWIKRSGMPVYPRLNRGHESIFIYGIDSSVRYNNACGKYEDVKVPGLLLGTIDIEGIKRYIAGLRSELNGRPQKISAGSVCHSLYARSFKESSRFTEMVNFTNVWSFLPHNRKTFNKGGKEHPTTKPLPIMERLVELLTPENATVLDPFMGSGTTGLACKKLNRHFIGIEKESEYFDIAKARIEGWQPDNQLNMFRS